MSNGVVISQNNEDLSSVSADKLYVGSDTPIFKLFLSGDGVQKINGTVSETYDITIEHGLGYAPFFIVFMDRNPESNRRLCMTSEDTPTALPNGLRCVIQKVDFKNIVIRVGSSGVTPVAGDYGYNYYIYYDKLAGF